MTDIFQTPLAGAAPGAQLIVATVGTATAAGVTLVLPGTTSASQKRYKRLITGESLTAGDLVLAAQISGSYVVLGKIAFS